MRNDSRTTILKIPVPPYGNVYQDTQGYCADPRTVPELSVSLPFIIIFCVCTCTYLWFTALLSARLLEHDVVNLDHRIGSDIHIYIKYFVYLFSADTLH